MWGQVLCEGLARKEAKHGGEGRAEGAVHLWLVWGRQRGQWGFLLWRQKGTGHGRGLGKLRPCQLGMQGMQGPLTPQGPELSGWVCQVSCSLGRGTSLGCTGQVQGQTFPRKSASFLWVREAERASPREQGQEGPRIRSLRREGWWPSVSCGGRGPSPCSKKRRDQPSLPGGAAL